MSETLIDHIFGTGCFNVSNVTQALGVSDHRMQAVDFNIPPLQSSGRQCWIRSFKKCDWNQLKAVLHAIPWNLLDTFDSIDDKWDFFHIVVSEALDIFLPLHKVNPR